MCNKSKQNANAKKRRSLTMKIMSQEDEGKMPDRRNIKGRCYKKMFFWD